MIGKKELCSLIIFISFPLYSFGPKTFFGTRSQGFSAMRLLAGMQQETHLFTDGCFYATFDLNVEYARSTDGDAISCFLFGSDMLRFSGSRVANRQPEAILADYFGLPSNFDSKVFFNPTITNFVVDLDWYLGLDSLVCGLFLRVNLPIVHTKWDLKLQECAVNGVSTITALDMGSATISYPAGYLGPQAIETSTLPTTVMAALDGKKTFGDMREPIKFGKLIDRDFETRVGDFTIIVGWDFLADTWYHLGAHTYVCAPTSNRSQGELLFEAITGNNHHWELGGGVSVHAQLWNWDDGRVFAWYFDSYIGHLFPSLQRRSYDFCLNGPGSRYMLLEYMGESQNLFVGANTLSSNQYTGRLVNAINITTLDSEIKMDVKADIVTKVAYQHCGIEADIGYEVYYRSPETLIARCTIPDNCFVFKGDGQIYGFAAPIGNIPQPVPLSVSQIQATIRAGQGTGNFVAGSEFNNANADNPVTATSVSGTPLTQLNTADSARLGIAQLPVMTSNAPIFINDSDINEASALLPRGFSQKLFFYVGRRWESECIDPFLGIGTFYEWANTDPCDNSFYSQWGIWVKGGLSY